MKHSPDSLRILSLLWFHQQWGYVDTCHLHHLQQARTFHYFREVLGKLHPHRLTCRWGCVIGHWADHRCRQKSDHPDLFWDLTYPTYYHSLLMHSC